MKIIKIQEQKFDYSFDKNKITQRKVLFVVLTKLNSTGNAGNYQDFPYGILSIIEHNKNYATFEILDLKIDASVNGSWLELVEEKIKYISPDILGISVMFDNAYHGIEPVTKIAKKIKPDIIILAGGPAISPAAKEVIRFIPDLDAICFSEGERPFEAVLLSENIYDCLQKHPSWVTQNKSNNAFEPQKTLIENLDAVANINFGLVNVKKYKTRVSFNPLTDRIDDEEEINVFPVVTSRGCPFKCSFCWHSGEDDTSMRYANVDAVVAHIEGLVSNFNAKAISIYDDMLLLPQKRAKDLFRKLAPLNLRIELPNGLSPTYIDEELVELMHKAGVRSVRLAIESGDEYVLHKIINKPLRVHMVEPVVKILRKYNIWIVGFFVVGMPGETDLQRKSTLDLIKKVGIDLSSISVASPSKGSLLYEQCIENDFIPNPNEEFIKSGYLPGEGVINTPEFSAEYISESAYIMNLEVNFVRNNRIYRNDCNVAKNYFEYIAKTYPFHAFAHYFLALFYIEKNIILSKKHHQRVNEICEIDSKWLTYFEHFRINYKVLDKSYLNPT